MTPSPDPPPAVLFWYGLFRAFLVFFYGALCGLGVWAAAAPDAPPQSEEMGLTIAIVGGTSALLFLASFFVPRRPWAWSLHMALIIMSIAGCATTVLALLMAWVWIKPETRAWFERAG